MQLGEQLLRRERRLDRDHLVEILWLIDGPERIGFLDRRHSDDARVSKRRDCGACPHKMSFAVTKVRAERDVSHVVHSALRSTTTSAYASGPASATCGFRTATR